jgi:hypothetical protein
VNRITESAAALEKVFNLCKELGPKPDSMALNELMSTKGAAAVSTFHKFKKIADSHVAKFQLLLVVRLRLFIFSHLFPRRACLHLHGLLGVLSTYNKESKKKPKEV